MDNSTVQKRIQISYRSQEIKGIREKMKKNQGSSPYIKISSAAAIITLFLGVALYVNSLNVDDFIRSTSYSYTTRDASPEVKNNLMIASEELLNQRYQYVIDLLQNEKDSDHKDWLLLNANLGLRNFEYAEMLMDEIQGDSKHLYHNRITIKFKLDIFMMRMFL
ncbi:hypothetical protein [Flammeovirga pacifica]|uniref:Uncharacterized protein n=1 Tax=Flammeovirga pacifica TaxID=915059 RepID=A0A1S1Z0B2_FLAPC|nr:hypothetical protein [Flammeovirga pacifica]OHX66692.1 hypothetical protein NH26_10135 [Flammeovirga pacifica]